MSIRTLSSKAPAATGAKGSSSAVDRFVWNAVLLASPLLEGGCNLRTVPAVPAKDIQ